ncbi:MAG: LysE family transporter [Acutalibacteraceae bacterium]|jgi:threonine/homoserine/homoserine lactone efflux protein
MLLLYFSAFAVGLSGAMMPGSLLTYVIRKALSNGAKAGLIVVLGHGILEASLVTLIFLGFDRLLKSDTAQIVIGITGGLLLCLMGIKMAVDAYRNKVKVEVGSGKAEGGSMVLSSIVLSAANPYFLLWWAIIGLGFIMQAHASFGYPGVIIYYCGHISADLAWYSLVSFVVGKTRKFIKEKPYRIIIAILGCLLVFFGVRFIYDAAEKLIKII